jgi:hypothetical protein
MTKCNLPPAGGRMWVIYPKLKKLLMELSHEPKSIERDARCEVSSFAGAGLVTGEKALRRLLRLLYL